VSTYYTNRINRFGGSNKLFINQANVFLEAACLNQRTVFTAKENKGELTVALLKQINELGITATTLPQAITALKTALKAAMPKDVQPYADDFWQQAEDISQGMAWTDDLTLLGYNLTSVPRTKQTRSVMQDRQQ